MADITYIRLAEEFVYLAVVLDSYSRPLSGWALERTLEAIVAVDALRMALDKREAPADRRESEPRHHGALEFHRSSW